MSTKVFCPSGSVESLGHNTSHHLASAYIYVGGLPDGITEGDLITICSQYAQLVSFLVRTPNTPFRYGEVVDVNMPRDKETGKTRGFGFIMYEDQRSTVLAVDNLTGGKILDRIIRVDHVKNYKQPKVRNDEGEWVDRDEQSLNALPKLMRGASYR
jgi:RNA-binding motif X-linked protein 2